MKDRLQHCPAWPGRLFRSDGSFRGRGCPRRPRGGHGFTLFEMLLVLAIISLVLAVVLPRIGRLPKRLAVESGCSAIRQAVAEAGLRARASGTPVRLILDVDENCFLVQSLAPAAVAGRAGPALAGGYAGDIPGTGAKEHMGHIVSTRSRYNLPGRISWRLDGGDEESLFDEEGRPVYSFFPSGEATGPRVTFVVAGRSFELEVDRLTGRPVIRDLDEGS